MVIDRIEGSVAVVEVAKGEFRDVPLTCIDGDARDGAVLAEADGRYTVDEAATAERRRALDERRRALFNRC